MFLIKEIAEKFDLKKDTIRYYDKIGLLKPSDRKQNGYRLYSINDFKKLSFILKAKSIGLSLKAIKDLVNMYENPSSYSCKEVKEVASNEISKLNQKINELEQMKKKLIFLEKSCLNDSSRDASNCSILNNLKEKNL